MSVFDFGSARPAALGDHVYLVHGRDISVFTTLERAIGWAHTITWSDDNWFDALEIVSRDGSTRRYESDDPEVRQWLREEDRRREQERKAKPGPAHLANLAIDDEIVNSYFGVDGVGHAEADAELLRPFLGDRVQVVRL